MVIRRWIILLCLFVIGIAPFFAPYNIYRQFQVYQPPSRDHWLGTDYLGRDVWSRFVVGGRHTLIMTCGACAIAIFMGSGLGLISAMSHNHLDRILTLMIDTLLAFPSMVLALILITLLGKGSWALIFAVGMTQIAPVARVIRAAGRSGRSRLYIQASMAMGGSHRHILSEHLLPAIQPTLFAYMTVTLAYCLLSVSTLTFLGLGGDLGFPDWGSMLYEARFGLRRSLWLSIPPGVAITFLLFILDSHGSPDTH